MPGMEEVERFANDLRLREPLRDRALRWRTPRDALRGKRSDTLLNQAVTFAASEGFFFDARDVRSYLKAKAAAQGEALTQKYIDSLPAQGFFPFAFFREVYLVDTQKNAPAKTARECPQPLRRRSS